MNDFEINLQIIQNWNMENKGINIFKRENKRRISSSGFVHATKDIRVKLHTKQDSLGNYLEVTYEFQINRQGVWKVSMKTWDWLFGLNVSKEMIQHLHRNKPTQ